MVTSAASCGLFRTVATCHLHRHPDPSTRPHTHRSPICRRCCATSSATALTTLGRSGADQTMATIRRRETLRTSGSRRLAFSPPEGRPRLTRRRSDRERDQPGPEVRGRVPRRVFLTGRSPSTRASRRPNRPDLRLATFGPGSSRATSLRHRCSRRIRSRSRSTLASTLPVWSSPISVPNKTKLSASALELLSRASTTARTLAARVQSAWRFRRSRHLDWISTLRFKRSSTRPR